VRRLRIAGFVISEFLLPAGYESQEHAHALPGLVLPVGGRLTMIESSTSLALMRGEALTLPPGAAHRERAPACVTCLLVEPTPEPGADLPPLFEELSAVRDPQIGRAAVRLAGSLGNRVQPGWEVEYDAVELVLLASHAQAPSRQTPRCRPSWIRQVIDRLRAEFSSPPTCSALAGGVGVSREHLAREFHRATGETLGTFLRRQRVLEAARMLRESDRPISRVAAAAGFVDQSHLTRQLRRYLGVTPGMLRARRFPF
jgi:AraC-like DNA-binding protein